MLDFDCQSIDKDHNDSPLNSAQLGILTASLHRAQKKCAKLSFNVNNQERNASVAEVHRVKLNRRLAKEASEDIEKNISKIATTNSLLFYFQTNLSSKNGLFYEIYRGGLRKRLLPNLPNETQERA